MCKYTIGIDCPPGNPRPGDLIDQVNKNTGLPSRNTISRLFGAWIWDYSDIENIEMIWQQHSFTINNRLKKLYESGLIRGSLITPASIRPYG